MKVTFKDVNQGDSIIIEWEDSEVPKVGIIDCKNKGNKNPVIEHLIDGGYGEIEFLYISHPHQDHYSGIPKLLEFIEEKKIKIKIFGHTFDKLNEFWDWLEVDDDATKMLADIARTASRLRNETTLIGRIQIPSQDTLIPLSKEINLKFLSPSYDEIEKFKIDCGVNKSSDPKKASEAANLLSTVICIEHVSGNNILLTSDAEIYTLQRINTQALISSSTIHTCQVPHHGSYNNYLDIFWASMMKINYPKAIVSSGENSKYQHPHFETIKEIDKHGFEIEFTNVVHGVEEYKSYLISTILLEGISELVEESIIGGDKIITI
ncbi:MAG: ComEC/Rec2 family competence protein [Fluviicola sp.]